MLRWPIGGPNAYLPVTSSDGAGGARDDHAGRGVELDRLVQGGGKLHIHIWGSPTSYPKLVDEWKTTAGNAVSSYHSEERM